MRKTFQAIALVIGALTIAACSSKEDDAKKSTVPQEKIEVKVQKVTSEEIPQTETYTANVESDVKNNISPNTPYRIERIYVDVGDRVSKGQTVVQLDASNLRQMQLQIENLRTEFNRTDGLYKVGGASKAEWDNAKMNLEVQETLYKQLAQNTRLVSPISGVVTARNYDNGDMYSGTPILTVEQLNPVKMIVNVSERFFKFIYTNMNVDIQLDAYEGEHFSGRISRIYPTVDANTHTFPVEVIVNNSSQKVRPGMFARATINMGSENRVLIPDVALVKQVGAGDRYVYIHNNGKVTYQKVELGKHFDDKYEVISGVEPGSEVVIAGMSRLANGREVTVVK
ncbi:MAG: efflux RND transporter periplasmic adaptor subunit [Bacteroidaceae bacterium]|jgi:RND family efflux transporter MFP subunit|nr:efflux RND transporter periplasmic adaptor subunit [Bacteroidaceae bacterium]